MNPPLAEVQVIPLIGKTIKICPATIQGRRLVALSVGHETLLLGPVDLIDGLQRFGGVS